ncbi:MAG: collagen-like triple helix repeat-containing protein [Cyclobacteriaceae bacterium]
MKRSIYFLFALLFTIISCEGPVGPEGPQGPQGQEGPPGIDAINIEGFAFEYEVNFGSDTNYEATLELPESFTMLESDVMVIYLLWEVDENGNEIWRQLPQTVLSEFGLFLYNFDFTMFDAKVFLEGEFDLSQLSDGDLLGQIFRVVVVPAQFVQGRNTIDLSDYNQVAEALNLKNLPKYPHKRYERSGTLKK